MNRYVCLLRGINVSGKNKIVMKELVVMFEYLGFRNVETYIQSGNVSFDSDVTDQTKLEELISDGIREHFGYEVKTFVRSKEQIRELLDRCPYSISELKENEQLYFSLLDSPRRNDDISLEIRTKTADECFILDNSIYILCRNGYGNTLLSNTFFEKKLKTAATTRNLATMIKLSE
ncbi:MAG: DUF1697 domain-containing protein [Bacteroidales bacterium]|nr:DUF1697 domain-containing protein [Bacteroidales bacterium]